MNNTLEQIKSDRGALADKILLWDERKGELEIQLKTDEPMFKAFMGKLKNLYELPPNWDSHGALPVSYGATINAIRLFCETMFEAVPPPQVVPTNKGNLQFEWHECAIDLEVEVLENGTINVFFEDMREGKPPSEWTESFSCGANQLRTLLQQLAERSWKEKTFAAA